MRNTFSVCLSRSAQSATEAVSLALYSVSQKSCLQFLMPTAVFHRRFMSALETRLDTLEISIVDRCKTFILL